MIKFKSIKLKLLFVLLLVGLIPIFIVGFLGITIVRKELNQAVSNKVLLLAEAKEGLLFAYLDSIESRTIDFASDSFIFDSLVKINKGENLSQTVEALNEHLVFNKQSLDKTIAGIFIMNVNGMIIASTNSQEIGKDESADEYFREGKKGVFTTELRGHGHFGLEMPFIVGSPITDKKTGELLGVLVNVFDTDKVEEILSGTFQLEKGAITGETGQAESLEVYLVNREKKMIAHPHGKEGLHFSNVSIDTLPVQKCLDNSEEFLGAHINYRGEEVIGASMCLLNIEWVLVVEVSTVEAFAIFNNIYLYLGLIMLLTILVVIMVAFIISMTISLPISKLQKGVGIIAKGNLGHRVIIKTGDEIERLGNAFNEMASKLQASYFELEGKVKERTTDLEGKVKEVSLLNKELEKSQEAVLNILEDVRENEDLLVVERDKLQTTLESIGDGAFTVDKKGEIQFFNNVAEKISGYKSEQVLGKHYSILKFIKEKDRTPTYSFIETALNKGEIAHIANHTLLIRPDNLEIQISDSAAPIKDAQGNVTGCIVVFRDVSHEREVDLMKTEFISLASHQLRTPLTAIRWMAELLQSSAVDNLSIEQKSYIQDIESSTKRLIVLINSLLNLSRIEEGRVSIKPVLVNLEDLIQKEIDEVRPFAKAKQCKIIFKRPKKGLKRLRLDPVIFGQVLRNLIGNAIQYSVGSGCKVEVSLKESDKKNYQFIVKDQGIGIPQKAKSRIFQRFYRAENAIKSETNGTGLGLYISKLIVESFGGKIWFKSVLGKGTTFFVQIPKKGMRAEKGEKTLIDT